MGSTAFVCKSCGSYDIRGTKTEAFHAKDISRDKDDPSHLYHDDDGYDAWDFKFLCDSCGVEAEDLNDLVIEADKFQGGSKP